MNKTAIKNYAIWARVQLIEAAKQRAFEYEITENGENKLTVDAIGGRVLSAEEKAQRIQLLEQIRRKGYAQVMEEAAYTWFNRFIALRFMEVNGYLPSKVRVFTDENGAFKPEILKQAMTVELEGLDRNKVLDLLDKQDNETLYKYLLISQCNALNKGLPYMFETISNWTELLFPANLLRSDSVIGQMISEIPEEDWTDAVQIIGWLYQYYNSELKDETFALLKKNVKITKERIPAATQLFTPDWIVRYMVENSLGRLWYEGHPDFDKSQWKYYLDEAEQEPEVEAQLQKIRAEYSTIKPEEIKVIDPCMGSGHILVYAFDVLMQIYTSAGWSERDAAKSILENNLYGLDIDDRAGQLAHFAVMMKARKHSRRILNGEVRPNVLSIQDSNWMTDEFISYVAGKDANMKADLVMLRKTFRDAKEYGSILNVPTMDYDAVCERIDIIRRSYAENLFEAQYQQQAVERLLPLVKQSQIMSQKYDVVVTNPPYAAASGLNDKLNSFLKTFYPNTKSDMFAAFIEKCLSMLNGYGFSGLITQHAWMFIASYEELRNIALKGHTLTSMAHLGNGAFGVADFGLTSFTIRNKIIPQYCGTYIRLVENNNPEWKEQTFLSNSKEYHSKAENYYKISGHPIAYWASEQMYNAFEKAGKFAGDTKKGVLTGDNNTYLRLWHEVSLHKVGFGLSSHKTMVKSGKKWFPVTSGGEKRRWYGNFDTLVNLENDGHDIKVHVKNYRLREPSYYFHEAITWTEVSLGIFTCRFVPEGILFGNGGPVCFFFNDKLKYYLGMLNSKVTLQILGYLAPTINYGPEQINRIPVLLESKQNVENIVSDSIEISKADWDSFETSWDFKKHPLV